MKSPTVFFLPASKPIILLVAFCLLASCSSLPLRPLFPGETRLSYIEMPDVVREGLSYDVILTLSTRADQSPPVKNVCFRWVAETISSASPSLYTYSMQDELHASSSSWTKWPSEGMTMVSDPFCVQPSDIRSDIPGKLIVKIRAANLKSEYNKLEGQAEYALDGQLRQTNWIGTRVLVEK